MAMYKPGRPIKYNPATQAGIKPPAAPGEYRIRDKEGRITYIGETCDLSRRTREHQRNDRLAPGTGGSTIEYKVADGRSSSRIRRKHEQKKIAQHSPVQNQSKGGEGRPAKR